MHCLFCKSNSASIVDEKSYEHYLGQNVFFVYKYLKCSSCEAEFLNDELSEFNAASYKAMKQRVHDSIISLKSNSHQNIEYTTTPARDSLMSVVYSMSLKIKKATLPFSPYVHDGSTSSRERVRFNGCSREQYV